MPRPCLWPVKLGRRVCDFLLLRRLHGHGCRIGFRLQQLCNDRRRLNGARRWRTRGSDEYGNQGRMGERYTEESGEDARVRHGERCCRPDAGRSERRGSHLSASETRRRGRRALSNAASCATDQQRNEQRRNKTDKQFHLGLLEQDERLLAVANWRADEKTGRREGDDAALMRPCARKTSHASVGTVRAARHRIRSRTDRTAP